MAATTYTAFVAALSGLSVTGVTRSYTYMPDVIATADLPILYPRFPRGVESTITTQTWGGWPSIRCEVVILVHPTMHEMSEQRYDQTLTLMDNLTTALTTASLAKSRVTWEIRADRIFQGDTEYYAVIADVESRG